MQLGTSHFHGRVDSLSHAYVSLPLIGRNQLARTDVRVMAVAASRAAAAAEAVLSQTSTSTSLPEQLQQYRNSMRPVENWDYKYQRYPCASPVQPGDIRCLKVEALFQNVLGYPRLPPRVYRYLQTNNTAPVEKITATVEVLCSRYGKELMFYLLRRTPLILNHDIESLIEQAEGARRMLDLKPNEVFMLLRKNPYLMVMETSVARARFNKLHHVTPLSHEAARIMVVKYPLILNRCTENVAAMTEKLRHLAYTRTIWQQDFDCISPSLLAFYYRDFRDLLHRLEYLALTGESPTHQLSDVFKVSNNLFAKKHRGFRQWLNLRAARREQLMKRAAAVAQRSFTDQTEYQEVGNLKSWHEEYGEF